MSRDDISRSDIVQKIRNLLAEYSDLNYANINESTPLIGSQAAIRSRVIVELMLGLEDYAEEELGFEFDWSSDAAMSEGRSMMRTVGSLADYLEHLRQRRAR
ncbi:MAG TPA: hypothetical protein VHG30_04285 [Microvirga sp.]|nr:hypothetical protein [Microvirga sp.]